MLEIVCASSKLLRDAFLLFKKRFGQGLNDFFSRYLTLEEQYKLDHVVLPRGGRELKILDDDVKKPQVKSVYDYYPNKKKSLVDKAIMLLEKKDKFIM